MSRLSLIWDNTRHDLASSDGRIILLTQTTLLFFLLTLTLTSASVQRYLSDNLSQMLGSDMVLEAQNPLAETDRLALEGMADATSMTMLRDITLTAADKWERVQLKLVDSHYPLQGELMTGATPAANQTPTPAGPPVGEIWLGPRLFSKLGVQVGETLTVADRDLRVGAVLFHEPDRILEGHSVALRALVHADSLDPTGLGTSRDRVRYLIEAGEEQRTTIEQWAKEAAPDAAIIKKYGGEHPLASFWRRTENFLGLSSVILFFMSAVAVDMTNRRWLAKMRYRIAIYSSFGTPLATGLVMTGVQWIWGFLMSTLLACVIAAGAFLAIIGELQSYFPGISASWHASAALRTMGLVASLFLILQVPTFLSLCRASLLGLIKSQQSESGAWVRLVWGAVAVSLLAVAYSDNWLLTGMTMAAMGTSLVLMIILSWAVIRIGDLAGRRRAGLLPFVFFIMRQRIFAKSAQILGLGLCGLLLLFTLMLMRDLGTMMEGYGRTHNGNLLISEAQDDQIAAIKDWANTTGSDIRQLRAFVSAQLISVNDVALADYMDKPSDTLASLKRPIRLSWGDAVADNNQQMGGTWWQAGTDNWQQISTEPEVMTDMGLSYGDTLTYRIAGENYRFTLVASHAYKPGGGSITFWFQAPASARAVIDAPTRYMGSMELPDNAWDQLAQLWQQFPSLSLVPLKELTDRFDTTLGIVTKVTTGFAAMVLVLALFVLAASVTGFQADDRKKNGLLMSMGLRQEDCLRLSLYDWAITALIAVTGAIVGTWIAGELIYASQFGLSYQPSALWIVGMSVAMVGVVCAVGLAVCRRSLQVSVRDLLTA